MNPTQVQSPNGLRWDQAALERIEAVVKEIERETAGEIVVVIAPRSDAWSALRATLAFALAVLGGAALSFVVDPRWLVLVFPALYVVGWLLAGLGPLTRACAAIYAEAGALDKAVARAAKIAFLDHGVHATKTRAGVLVYVSLLERRVFVLGDAGVHALVGDAGWAAYAARVSGAMKTQDEAALLGVLRDVGATLAKAFPRADDDVNELSDAVRLG